MDHYNLVNVALNLVNISCSFGLNGLLKDMIVNELNYYIFYVTYNERRRYDFFGGEGFHKEALNKFFTLKKCIKH